MSQLTKHISAPIEPSNPWSDDVLRRRDLAQQLTAALSTVTQPFVLGLHGEFGNGKTFFIERWRRDLLNAGDVAVYFNAWETDYAAEPLIAFTAAIKNQLEEHGLKTGKKTAKALAASAGRIVAGAVLPRLASYGAGVLIPESAISALATGAASEITGKTVDEAVKHHEEARDEVKRFCSILTGCAAAIATRETGQVRKLIVFVDELDRCRPDYAVHVLECIKHFFAVDNVIFVIAIDRDALAESVRAVYGDGIDVDGYLRKFFDYNVEFAPPKHEAFALLLGRSLRLEEIVHGRLPDWIQLFSACSKAFNLPLRVQEQVLSKANFIVRSYNTNNWFIHDLILMSLCIQARNPDLFDRITEENDNLMHQVEQMAKADATDEDVRSNLQYGVTVLLAGFASVDTMKAEQAALASRLDDRSGDLPAGERQNLERQMQTLDRACQIVREYARGRPIGRGVVQRIRFLAE